MKKVRAVKRKARQQALVTVKFRHPPVVHRQVTAGDYTLPEILALVAEGWTVTSCHLERIVEVDAIETRYLPDNPGEVPDIPAEVQPE